MREIKFRAWDKLNKEMFNVESINFQERRVYRDAVSYCNFNDIELMQYTGLKDKNKKEIYEGDILLSATEDGVFLISIDFGDPDREDINTLKGFKMKIEKVLSESQYFEYFNNKLIELINKYSIPVEVYNNEKYISDGWWIIGNIYENPELIKE